MFLVHGSKNFPKDTAPIVAMGNFDGVHLAHRRVISLSFATAKDRGLKSCVYTFDPHPAKILSPEGCPPLLQTPAQKLASIEATGVDICVVEKFNSKFAALTPEVFLDEVISVRLKAKGLVVGYDFTFGSHRHGTALWLKEKAGALGIDVMIVEAQFLDETLLSSTNIRQLIRKGDVSDATKFLGRPYEIEGTVVKGRGLGANLGVHTANIESINEVIPADGVYLTVTQLLDTRCPNHRTVFHSITSIGTNPTFHEASFAIETHLLDANVDALGQRAVIKFLDKMRDQIAFASPEELKKQIKKDIEDAKKRHRAAS